MTANYRPLQIIAEDYSTQQKYITINELQCVKCVVLHVLRFNRIPPPPVLFPDIFEQLPNFSQPGNDQIHFPIFVQFLDPRGNRVLSPRTCSLSRKCSTGSSSHLPDNISKRRCIVCAVGVKGLGSSHFTTGLASQFHSSLPGNQQQINISNNIRQGYQATATKLNKTSKCSRDKNKLTKTHLQKSVLGKGVHGNLSQSLHPSPIPLVSVSINIYIYTYNTIFISLLYAGNGSGKSSRWEWLQIRVGVRGGSGEEEKPVCQGHAEGFPSPSRREGGLGAAHGEAGAEGASEQVQSVSRVQVSRRRNC